MKKMHFLIALTVFAMLSVTVSAQVQHTLHPNYLEALGQLRDARWLLIHRGVNDPAQAKEEQKAIAEVEAAIKEITNAAIDDGKSLDHAPHEDNKAYTVKDRLKWAYEYMRKADKNILHEDANPVATDMRNRCHAHIKEAQNNIELLWNVYKIPR